MTTGTRLDWHKIFATLLLLPNIAVTVLAAVNLFLDINVMDLYGMRILNIVTGCIIATGGIITCASLARPGKFTSLGWYPKIRVTAAVWNFLNALWLGWIFWKLKHFDHMQAGEMMLAVVTLSALLIFAIEEKKP